MAAKNDNNIFLLALLAAGGYYWYKKQQESKPAITPPIYQKPPNQPPVYTSTDDVPAGPDGTFINYNGVEDNVDIANNEFNSLIASGFVNGNAGSLPLTPYEKDVVYWDFHNVLLPNEVIPHVTAEATKVYQKYPGLKV